MWFFFLNFLFLFVNSLVFFLWWWWLFKMNVFCRWVQSTARLNTSFPRFGRCVSLSCVVSHVPADFEKFVHFFVAPSDDDWCWNGSTCGIMNGNHFVSLRTFKWVLLVMFFLFFGWNSYIFSGMQLCTEGTGGHGISGKKNIHSCNRYTKLYLMRIYGIYTKIGWFLFPPSLVVFHRLLLSFCCCCWWRIKTI